MALIKCSDCGKEVSDNARACIHCGNPLPKKKKEIKGEASDGWAVLGIIFPVVGLIIYASTKNNHPSIAYKSLEGSLFSIALIIVFFICVCFVA